MSEADPNRLHVLFLDETVCGRARLADACARSAASARNAPAGDSRTVPVRVWSAGLEQGAGCEVADGVLHEAGYEPPEAPPSLLSELDGKHFDVVICLTDAAAARCPILPGNPEKVSWALAPHGADPAAPARLREELEAIRHLVRGLFEHGYLDALGQAKRQSDLILDNLFEGIIAHDFERRIFYFNHAAEVITGYPRDEVIGRDCHDVFPFGFCEGRCIFGGGPGIDADHALHREMRIHSRDGELREVRTSVKTLLDSRGRPVGILGSFTDETRMHELARRAGEIEQFSGIVGRDEKMLEVFDLIRDVADSDVSVLIQGESGTGKELVARAVHNEGSRSARAFVAVNCAALPEGLLESEMFGHVRGAFTGAVRDKKGRFELADGGTIFLDEIAELPPSLQVKLLRVLQEGVFERVGSEETQRVDVRVISATNRDLNREIAAERFREDLFYRLAVVPIRMPSLAERSLDIPLLAEHILKRLLRDRGRDDVQLSTDALGVLMSYDWPGNVRELQNWIQFALVKCKGVRIEPSHLPDPAVRPGRAGRAAVAPEVGFGHGGVSTSAGAGGRRGGPRHNLEESTVRRALAECGENRTRAAERLGVSRATLYRFLTAHDMT